MKAKAEAKAIEDAEAAASAAAAAVATEAAEAAAAAERAAVEAVAVEEKEAAAEAQAKAQAQAVADAQVQARAQAEVQAAAVAEVKADPTALAEKLRLLDAERQCAERAILWCVGASVVPQWCLRGASPAHTTFWPPGATLFGTLAAVCTRGEPPPFGGPMGGYSGRHTRLRHRVHSLCFYHSRRRPRPSQGSMPTLTLDAISSLPSTPRARARAAVASYSSRWQPSRRSAPHCRITAEDPRD